MIDCPEVPVKLFAEYELRSFLNGQDKKIAARIDAFTNDEIMANDLRILCDFICEQFRIDPLVLMDEDVGRRQIDDVKIQKWIDPVTCWTQSGRRECRVVDGVTVAFYYPFTGTEFLAGCQASTYMLSGHPEVTVQKNAFVITLQYQNEETREGSWKERVERSKDEALSFVRQNVEWVNRDLHPWRSGLRERVLKQLEEKKARVENFYAAAKLFDVSPKINRDGACVVAVKKKTIPIAHSCQVEDEQYCISDSSYEETLSVIKHTASTWERTPSSYRGMKEEDLRNVLLSSLNALFDGQATGEAFRRKGKTDICIEEKNRAAFVAECKMWTGEMHITDALSQLDSYTTWRDCKTALIYFVRRKDFVAVLNRMESALRGVDSIRKVQKMDENEFKCSMVSAANPGRLTDVRVLLFNLQPE